MIASVDMLRADEAMYRSRGRFDLAVVYQRQADLLEAGEDVGRNFCAWYDRGAMPQVVAGMREGMFLFPLPSGLCWVLARDNAEMLFSWLIELLDLPSETYLELAWMARERRAEALR